MRVNLQRKTVNNALSISTEKFPSIWSYSVQRSLKFGCKTKMRFAWGAFWMNGWRSALTQTNRLRGSDKMRSKVNKSAPNYRFDSYKSLCNCVVWCVCSYIFCKCVWLFDYLLLLSNKFSFLFTSDFCNAIMNALNLIQLNSCLVLQVYLSEHSDAVDLCAIRACTNQPLLWAVKMEKSVNKL